ncbi:MAG: NAD(P)/FAD-dependent oxidoreductase [Phycisphaerae bacterium]
MNISVFGGGVIGLTCAWRLAQAGATVSLYDARRQGQGASGAALGALWPAAPLANFPHQVLQRQSLWHFESFLHELSTFANHPISFRRLGRIELLNSPKAVARANEQSAAANAQWPALAPGYPIMETLAPIHVAALLPTLAARHEGALLCRATAAVEIPDLLHALESACRHSGVAVHWNSPLETLPSDGISLVTAGAWTQKLLPDIPITPAKGQAIALSVPPGLHLRHIVKDGPTYLLPWTQEILVGSTTEPEAAFNEDPTPEARQDLHRRAAALFPELAHSKIRRHWAGLRPDAPHHAPIVGPFPHRLNTFVAGGFYKTGIGLAPLIAKLVTSMILNNTIPPELLPFLPKA